MRTGSLVLSVVLLAVPRIGRRTNCWLAPEWYRGSTSLSYALGVPRQGKQTEALAGPMRSPISSVLCALGSHLMRKLAELLFLPSFHRAQLARKDGEPCSRNDSGRVLLRLLLSASIGVAT